MDIENKLSNKYDLRFLAYILNLELLKNIAAKIPYMVGFENLSKPLYDLVYYASLFFSLFYTLYRLIKKKTIRPSSCIIVLFLSIMLIISALLIPENSESLEAVFIQMVLFYALSMPVFIIASDVIDWSAFAGANRIYVLLSFLYSVFFIFTSIPEYIGYGGVSSALIFPTMIALYSWYRNRKKLDLVIFLVNICVIFIGGQRTPAGGLLFSILFLLILTVSSRRLPAKKVIVMFSAIALLVMCILFLKVIIGVLFQLFPDSRTVIILNTYTKTHDSTYFLTGRETEYAAIKGLFSERPLTGHGIFGAEYGISRYNGYAYLQKGMYSHNIFADFIIQYGLIIGFIFSALFVGVILYNIRLAVKKGEYLFIGIISITTFTIMMFSSTYINDQLFWFITGFAISNGFLKQEGDSFEVRSYRLRTDFTKPYYGRKE